MNHTDLYFRFNNICNQSTPGYSLWSYFTKTQSTLDISIAAFGWVVAVSVVFTGVVGESLIAQILKSIENLMWEPLSLSDDQNARGEFCKCQEQLSHCSTSVPKTFEMSHLTTFNEVNVEFGTALLCYFTVLLMARDINFSTSHISPDATLHCTSNPIHNSFKTTHLRFVPHFFISITMSCFLCLSLYSSDNLGSLQILSRRLLCLSLLLDIVAMGNLISYIKAAVWWS